ncbi:MAG: carboxypeptidase-like regulatory domain-containing protein [Candidatus Sericytochromatia bacterium]|nr:carboxypeptidase-like regulatory domain-containing protein [Candidatus Sericytochromatia bacterium]
MLRSSQFRGSSLPLMLALAIAGCAPGFQPAGGLGVPGAPAGDVAVMQDLLAAGTVKGRVMAFDPAKGRFEPVAGASVAVQGGPQVATSDANGFYTLTGVAPGAHMLRATKDGLTQAEAPIHVNKVMGIADVHLAMGKPAYGLKQTPATELFTGPMTVFGVVRDPRGCAVPNSTLYVTSSSGNVVGILASDHEVDVVPSSAGAAAVVTTLTGFYTFRVNDADDYTRVTISASGRTRGGIAMERNKTTVQEGGTYAVDRLEVETGGGRTVTDGSKPVTSALWTQGFDIQLNKFLGTKPPTSVGSYVTGAQAKFRVAEGLSSRPDEFFIRLRQGKEDYDIVPIAVTAVAGSAIAREVTFRVPSTISTLNNFTVTIMQLGLTPSAASLNLRATSFGEAEYRNTIASTTAATLTDVTTNYTTAEAHFINGEELQVDVPVRNAHTRLTLDMALTFVTPGVASITSAELQNLTAGTSANLTANYDGVSKRVSVPFELPPRSSTSHVEYSVRVRFKTAAPTGSSAYTLSSMALEETSMGYKTADAYFATATLPVTLGSFESTQGNWAMQKTIDETEIANGFATVTLAFEFDGDYLASYPMPAVRVVDITPIDYNTEASEPANPEVSGGTILHDLTASPAQATVNAGTSALSRRVQFRVLWKGQNQTVPVTFEPGDYDLAAIQGTLDTAFGAATDPLPAGTVVATQAGSNTPLRFVLGDGGTAIELVTTGSALTELGLNTTTTAIATRAEVVGYVEAAKAATPPVDGWTVSAVSSDVVVGPYDVDGILVPALTIRSGALRGRQDAKGRSVFAFEAVPGASGTLENGTNFGIFNLNRFVVSYRIQSPDGSALPPFYGAAIPYTALFPSRTRIVAVAYPSTGAGALLTWFNPTGLATHFLEFFKDSGTGAF